MTRRKIASLQSLPTYILATTTNDDYGALHSRRYIKLPTELAYVPLATIPPSFSDTTGVEYILLGRDFDELFYVALSHRASAQRFACVMDKPVGRDD